MGVSRRSFLKGIGALVAAPAVVKAENIMTVSSRLILPEKELILPEGAELIIPEKKVKTFGTMTYVEVAEEYMRDPSIMDYVESYGDRQRVMRYVNQINWD